MKKNQPITITDGQTSITVRKLNLQQASYLDGLLQTVEPYGEVRIVVKNGKVTYLDALKRYKVAS